MLPSVRYRSLSSRGRLLLSGADRKRFLHGMVTNDVTRLQPGQGCRAAMLTVKGKMLADLLIHEWGDEGLLLEMEGSVCEKIATALDRHLIMDDVLIRNVSAELDQIGVYGSDAATVLFSLLGGPEKPVPATYNHVVIGAARVAATPELAIPGFHVFMPQVEAADLLKRLAAAGAVPLEEDEAEVLRIEAGRPRYGLDMDEERLPIEANLDDAISFEKGCYLGQEVIARVSARGHVNRKLVGLRFPSGGDPPPRGTALWHESRPGTAGTIMSGARSPLLGTIALAYVHRTLWDPGTRLAVSQSDGAPGREALVCTLPFSAS